MSRNTKTSRLLGVVAVAVGCAALFSVAPPACASVKPHDPPVASGAAAWPDYDRPYKYSNYDPFYEVQPSERADRLDTTSVALGALGGIALAGATLGITLGVQRRRDQSSPTRPELRRPD